MPRDLRGAVIVYDSFRIEVALSAYFAPAEFALYGAFLFWGRVGLGGGRAPRQFRHERVHSLGIEQHAALHLRERRC